MITDNYAETVQRLAKFILESPLSALLREHDREQLQRNAEGDEGKFYGLEFRKEAAGYENDKYPPRCECTLYVDLTCDYDAGRVEDEEGSVYRKHKVEAKVSWASWGSTEAPLASQRVELMRQVCELAAAIDQNFAEAVYYRWATKAEIEASKKAAEERKLQAFYTAHVTANAYRMLVGQQRVAQLPEGTEGQWEGIVDWPRPNGDVWRFQTKANGRHCIFTRIENEKK
ncbi:MAG: hypothetical protein JO270_00100 [Acidobacteriaceae bacterium]|nr:hypothetical protein [Acidobacteriaceae bacterium]